MAGVSAMAGSTGAQTFSYSLIGRVTSVKPFKTVKVEREVYQPVTIDVPLRNSTNSDGMFKVWDPDKVKFR